MAVLAADGDHLEIVVRGHFDPLGDWVNVFHYDVLTADGATLQQFGVGLYAAFYSDMLLYMSDKLKIDEIETKRLDNTGNLEASDVWVLGATFGIGQDTAELVGFQEAYTFRLLRPDASFRHGYKRIPGVTEATISDGYLLSTLTDEFDALAIALASELPAFTLVGGVPDAPVGASSMVPMMLQRVESGDILNPPRWARHSACSFIRIGSQDTRTPS